MTEPPNLPGAGPAAPEETVPTCYRHPGRETYVRCQRCNRPICPECQIPASVGVQCPECVREGNRSIRPTRTTLGGIARGGSGAPVTMTLIGVCVLAFLAQQSIGSEVLVRFGLIGGVNATDLGLGVIGVADGEYYRLLSAAFLHGGFLHLLVNMFSLYLLGPQLEAMLGRSRFVALYLVSAVGGTAVSYLLNPPFQFSVGASGAIFGLFGAMVVVSRRLNYDLRPVLGIIGVNAVIGFVVPQIDWQAHLGGLLTGGLIAAAMVYAPRDRRTVVQVAGTGLVLALVAFVVLVRTGQLT